MDTQTGSKRLDWNNSAFWGLFSNNICNMTYTVLKDKSQAKQCWRGVRVTTGYINLPGIASSWTRNSPEEIVILTVNTRSTTRNLLEEELFPREIPAHGRGIRPRNEIPRGMTSSWAMIQTKAQNSRKIFWTVIISATLNPIYQVRAKATSFFVRLSLS
jgi:hypothetical protein